jgi:mono/diheme cytochrome c family protein
MFRPLIVACGWLILLGNPAHPADADRGQAIARENCGRCHAIGRISPSPHKQAPPFRYVARQGNPADLEEALAEGIVVGHKDMPEIRLSPRDIDDFIAYLKRLRRR